MVSRHNGVAMKHSITTTTTSAASSALLLTGRLRVPIQQLQVYREFEAAWRNQLRPVGLTELESFQDFVRAAWHKREVIAAQDHAASDRQLNRLYFYEAHFRNRAEEHLDRLRQLQAERAARHRLL